MMICTGMSGQWVKYCEFFRIPRGLLGLWIIRSVEVEEGGRVSLRPVSYLVPLELDCHDNERNNTDTEMVSDYQAASFSEADEPPQAEPSISGLESPISLGLDSSSSEPNEGSQALSASMQLNGLEETHHHESADIPERDTSLHHRASMLAQAPTSPPSREKQPSSRQSPTPSSELANLSDTPTDELIMQRQPCRAATRQRQLLQELLQRDLI